MKKLSRLIILGMVTGMFVFTGILDAQIPGQPCGIKLSKLSKAKGYPGTRFVMYGTWGSTQGTKIPFINKGKLNKLIVNKWTASALHVTVPKGLAPGAYRVGVYCHALSAAEKTHGSNTMAFQILPVAVLAKPRIVLFPDLAVTSLRVLKDCYLSVTIKNIGRVGVPASVYQNPGAVAIQMYNGSKPWGGMILGMFDPDGKLKKPGGVATKVWFRGATNLKIGPRYASIKVVVDPANRLKEMTKKNNLLIRRLFCKIGVKLLPDLIIKYVSTDLVWHTDSSIPPIYIVNFEVENIRHALCPLQLSASKTMWVRLEQANNPSKHLDSFLTDSELNALVHTGKCTGQTGFQPTAEFSFDHPQRRLRIDVDNKIKELNESNNTVTWTEK